MPGKDKLLHVLAYALMGILACRALASLPRSLGIGTIFTAGLLFTFLFGLSDEWHQSLNAARNADGWDLVANGIGALLGAGWYCWRYRSQMKADTAFPR